MAFKDPAKIRAHNAAADSRRDPVKHKAYKKKHYAENKHLWRNLQLKKQYGITLEQYNEMFAQQNGLCAACNSPPGKRVLAVDHCHETGQVRGLLCGQCNVALGMLRDCSARLDLLKAYINKWTWLK